MAMLNSWRIEPNLQFGYPTRILPPNIQPYSGKEHVVLFLSGDSPASEVCVDVSEHKIQMSRNHPKERIQHPEYGESMKSRRNTLVCS